MGDYPSGFLWGTATAAYQVEGNNISSDKWLMEHLPGTIFTEPSGDACDHYLCYREDIAPLAGLGFNAYRFSIEWTRVEPEAGSAFDNFEWTQGYRPTFGLIAVDRVTQQRTIKQGARWLGGIGRANNVSVTA